MTSHRSGEERVRNHTKNTLRYEEWERLNKIFVRYGFQNLVNWWTEEGWHRDGTKNIPYAATQLLAAHLYDPNKSAYAVVTNDLRRMLAHFDSVTQAAQVTKPVSKSIQYLSQRDPIILAAIKELVGEAIAATAVVPPPTPIDERPLVWDRLSTRIKKTSAKDKKYKERWNKLRADYEYETGYDHRSRAKELGIDMTPDGWHRELMLREPLDIVEGHLDLARRIYPDQDDEIRADEIEAAVNMMTGH